MYGFFFDFDENGRNDFVVVYSDSNGKSTIKTFYNHYSRDSYFMIASVYTASSSLYGSKVYGASTRGLYTSLKDK